MLATSTESTHTSVRSPLSRAASFEAMTLEFQRACERYAERYEHHDQQYAAEIEALRVEQERLAEQKAAKERAAKLAREEAEAERRSHLYLHATGDLFTAERAPADPVVRALQDLAARLDDDDVSGDYLERIASYGGADFRAGDLLRSALLEGIDRRSVLVALLEVALVPVRHAPDARNVAERASAVLLEVEAGRTSLGVLDAVASEVGRAECRCAGLTALDALLMYVVQCERLGPPRAENAAAYLVEIVADTLHELAGFTPAEGAALALEVLSNAVGQASRAV